MLLLPVHVPPFHNAARIDAAFDFYSCHDGYCSLQCGLQLAEMLSIILLAQTLLIHVLPFRKLLGSMLAKQNLHVFGQLLHVTERLLQFAEILRFTTFNSASGDQPV